jgi:hypothetical protein
LRGQRIALLLEEVPSSGTDDFPVVLREWFNECAFQGAMHAYQRQSLRVIFDFQCGLSMKIMQKLKEDQRFRFPNDQSYSLFDAMLVMACDQFLT